MLKVESTDGRGGRTVGCARIKMPALCGFFYAAKKKFFVAGRIAVIKEYRGKHLGAQLLAATEQAVVEKGGSLLVLAAQVRACHFYEKQGYTAFGSELDDEGCPHIWMRKSL